MILECKSKYADKTSLQRAGDGDGLLDGRERTRMGVAVTHASEVS